MNIKIKALLLILVFVGIVPASFARIASENVIEDFITANDVGILRGRLATTGEKCSLKVKLVNAQVAVLMTISKFTPAYEYIPTSSWSDQSTSNQRKFVLNGFYHGLFSMSADTHTSRITAFSYKSDLCIID